MVDRNRFHYHDAGPGPRDTNPLVCSWWVRNHAGDAVDVRHESRDYRSGAVDGQTVRFCEASIDLCRRRSQRLQLLPRAYRPFVTGSIGIGSAIKG